MGYLYLPGSAGNYASTPDVAALDITGDIDLRIRLRRDDWNAATTGTRPTLISKRSSSSDYSFDWWISTVENRMDFGWTENGSTEIVASGDNNDLSVLVDGEIYWLRVTLDVDNGAGGYEAKTYYSADDTNDPDQVTWTTLSTRVGGSTTSIHSGASDLWVGELELVTFPLEGGLRRATIKNGIDGTTVFNPDFTQLTQAEVDAASFTEETGKAVTINGSAWTYVTPPRTVSATAASPSQITVTWENVSDETGYIVERSLNGSSGWTNISGTLAADTTSYDDTSLEPGTYFYRVTSVFAVGNSEPSAVVSATVGVTRVLRSPRYGITRSHTR